MKSRFRTIIFFTLYYFGIGFLFKKYNQVNKKIPVLLFHRVSDKQDKFWEPLSTDLFNSIIHFLSKRYSFITIDELLSGEIKDFKNKCLITFDDGYDDFVKNALPLLKQYQITPTFFITTNCISKNEIIWTSELNKSIENTSLSHINFKEEGFNELLSLSSQTEKLKTAKILLNYLKSLANHKRVEIFKRIKSKLSYHKPLNQNMLSWSDLNLIKDNVDIQSHSATHPMFTNLNKAELCYELEESKNKIENELSVKVNYFSYPIGDYNDSTINQTKEFYNASFIVSNELLDTKKIADTNYRHQLPRINITDKSVYEVFFRINGFHTLLRRR